MKKHLLGSLALSAIFFTAGPSNAGADVDAPKVDKTKKAPAAAPLSDKIILLHLYLENLREADMDRVAQQRAFSPQVQNAAADFMKDHALLAKEMLAQAGRLGVKLGHMPNPHSNEAKRAARQFTQLKKLKLLAGKDFDRRYKTLMTHYHQDTLRFIERQRSLLPKDSPVFNLLANVLPKVRDHYDVLTSTAEFIPS
jgi:predicted outer membrane protein